MDTLSRVILVEDDTQIAKMVSDYLSENGFVTLTLHNGEGLLTALDKFAPDIVILDLMLPGENGLELLKKLKAHSNCATIMLTARKEETDRIVGLEMGADDYVGKPFSLRELLARIRAVLRRVSTNHPASQKNTGILAFEHFFLDFGKRQLKTSDEELIQLTSGEFELLACFCNNAQRTISRDELLTLTRGANANPFDRSIDTLVSRLRQKIESDPKTPTLIKTVRLGGYFLSADVRRLD